MKLNKISLTLLAALTIALNSCSDHESHQDITQKSEFNEFNFSTIRNKVNLEVDYRNNGVKASVYFEIYDVMPVEETEYGYVKKDDVMPLSSYYTDKDGVFKGEIDLPDYVQKVYIYTPAFFARTLIEADVTGNLIKALGNTSAVSRAVAATTAEYNSYMTTPQEGTPVGYRGKRWLEWLGSFDHRRNGEIQYKYTGPLAATESNNLYETHTRFINIHKVCPPEYRSHSDMYIEKESEAVVTFLGQNTCWNNSIGYYFYKEGERPANLQEADVVMLIPNTQDGEWSPIGSYHQSNIQKAKASAGIDRQTAVQLKFYPHIKNGSKEGETTLFPAGYRIGFVLANNAWSNRVYENKGYYRASTCKGFSVDENNQTYDQPRTAVYKAGEWIIVSFEDYKDDQNFSDVVLALKTKPVDAISGLPVLDTNDNKTTIACTKGAYAFEDLWPYKGDYDMNDVVVRYNYEKTFDTQNKIYSEAFIFKTFENHAAYNNGLAFKLNSTGTISSTEFYVKGKGEETFTETTYLYDPAEKIYTLTEHVKDNMGAEFKVKVNYASPINQQSDAQAFIFKNEENDKRWEVHITQEAPSAKINTVYLGKGDDASQPDKGIYYVRAGYYPFAFFLSGANERDLARILEPKNEMTPIDHLYSGYKGWVESQGQTNKDWYKNN